MQGRLTLLAVLAIASACVLSATASGSGGLGISFDRTTAHAGEWMTGTGVTPWSGSTTGVTAYFTSTRLPAFKLDYNGIQPRLAKPPKRGVWRLGGLSVRRHRLYIRFRVPNVRPGDYTFAFYCTSCGTGGTFFLQTLWGTTWPARQEVVLRVLR